MTKYNLEDIFEKEEGIEYITEDNKYRVKVLRGELVHTDTTPCAFIKYYTKIKFIEVEKPVNFMEALANDKKCNIRNNIIDEVYRKQKEHNDDEYKIDIVRDLLEEKYYHMNDIIYAISGYMGCDDWENLINNGEFYIEK